MWLEIGSLRDSLREAETAQPGIHPAMLDFDKLMSDISVLLNSNLVEKHIDTDTGLEIYSYCERQVKVNLSSVEGGILENAMFSKDIYRGLVLNPFTKTIADTPFVRFRKPNSVEKQSRADCMVRASPKLD